MAPLSRFYKAELVLQSEPWTCMLSNLHCPLSCSGMAITTIMTSLVNMKHEPEIFTHEMELPLLTYPPRSLGT